MADNYLEKRYEEVFGSRSATGPRGVSLNHPSLEKLLHRGGTCLRFDPSYTVHILQLNSIIAVNSHIDAILPRFRQTPHSASQSCAAAESRSGSAGCETVSELFRFRTVVKGDESAAVISALGLDSIPAPGSGSGSVTKSPCAQSPCSDGDSPSPAVPEAFIIVYGNPNASRDALICLGMSLQTMSLKAVDLGLGSLIISDFDKDILKAALSPEPGLDAGSEINSGSYLEPLAVLAIGKSLSSL